jgi:DNA repair protein RecO (recombination protein O)
VALVNTRAVVLQSFAYSDTSKILRLFSSELGVRSVIAKGARQPRSRFGGVLEPFSEGYAQFYLKEGRDLHTLGGFDLLRSRQAIGRSLGAFAGASLMAELVMRFATEEPNPPLFTALTRSLDELTTCRPEEAPHVALAGAWQMVALLGYEPQLEACVGCGSEARPGEATRFDVEAGGVACTRCRPHGRVVSAPARQALQQMIAGAAPDPAAPVGELSVLRALLRAFLNVHLAPGHPLRSLDLFVEHFA